MRQFLTGQSSMQGIALRTPGPGSTKAITPASTVVNVDSRGGLAIPAAVKPGTFVRCTILVSAAATISTNTISAHFGTANTNADTTLYSVALTAGAASAGFCTVTWNVSFLSSTTAHAMVTTALSNTTNGFTAANQDLGNTAAVTIATTSASFLGFYISSTVNNNITVQNVLYEVVAA